MGRVSVWDDEKVLEVGGVTAVLNATDCPLKGGEGGEQWARNIPPQ